jgi:hypothetical protein
MGYLIKIMKSLLSLVLPGNPNDNASRRFLKGGRKAYAFAFGQPAILGEDGSERGISGLLPSDDQTNSTATVQLTKRVNYLTHTAATVTAYLPPVAGELREVVVIKNGANGVTVTKATTDATNIILSAAAAAGSTNTVASATAARYLSDGTNWFRVTT